MRAPCLLATLLASVAFASVPALALAQVLPSVDVRTWRPSADPQATLFTEPVATPGAWQWNAAAWASYAQSPVVLRDTASGNVAWRPLASSLGMDLVAGLGLGDRASIGVDVPVYLWQDGTSGLPLTILTGRQVPASGIGDVSILGKATVVDNQARGIPSGFGLAALGAVSLPTGDRSSFWSDGSTTVSLRALAEYAVGVGAVRATLGYTLRTAHDTWPDRSIGGVTFGDEIPWSFGALLRPKVLAPALDRDDRQLWEIALHGALPAGPVAPFGLGDPGASALSPALFGLDDRIELGHYRDAFVLAGADVGLDQAVGVPTFRAVLAVGWAPRPHDRDHDGIADDVDECPDLAEDRDGIQDEDGCPEDDADDDGILDTQDACPLVPGVWWNDARKNGCPAPDTDGDGVPDPADACPAVKGARSDDPKRNGCPAESRDRDGDGIPDDADRCPDEAEDKDGNEDFDGCPDPDDDGDGIPDTEDACPKQKGEPSTDPTRDGCPNPDRDGDSYDDDLDRCPDQAEVFNGVKDDDGCPDQGGKPLVTVDQKKDSIALRPASPIAFAGTAAAPSVDPKSDTTLRAIALELDRHPDWTLLVGVRPGAGAPAAAQSASLARAMALVGRITQLTHRPSSAEAVGWDAVKQRPTASSGVGLVVLVTPVEKPAVPLPERK